MMFDIWYETAQIGPEALLSEAALHILQLIQMGEDVMVTVIKKLLPFIAFSPAIFQFHIFIFAAHQLRAWVSESHQFRSTQLSVQVSPEYERDVFNTISRWIIRPRDAAVSRLVLLRVHHFLL